MTRALLALLLVLGTCASRSEALSRAEQDEVESLEKELDREMQERHFTNEWAVHVRGGRDVVDAIARDLGYESQGQVSI
jgi:hypothetical protein